MGLNIKNENTHRLVRELAKATGQSQTATVEDAVRRRLADLADGLSSDQHERRRRANAIAADFQADLTPADRERIRACDDWMYDQAGLPR